MIDMSYEDLNRTYHHTFLGYKLDGTVVPFYIRECRTRNMLRGEVEGDLVEVNINDPEVVLRFPDSGVYTVGGNRAGYVSRRASRQWRRGIIERELRITGDVGFGSSLVKSMFNPVYVAWNEALPMAASSGFRSVGLSRNWWLRKQDDAENVLIYFRERVVGEIKDGSPVFCNRVMKDLFEEEV